MKRIIKILTALAFIYSSIYAGPHYISGNIVNVTSMRGGLLVMLDTGTPDNCSDTGNPAGWMKINETDKAMTAMLLTAWSTGKKKVSIYTDATSSGYCSVNQIDPHED